MPMPWTSTHPHPHPSYPHPTPATLRPASRPDLPAIATVGALAFRDTPLYVHFAPRHLERSGEDFRAALLLDARMRFESAGQCVVVAELAGDKNEDGGDGKGGGSEGKGKHKKKKMEVVGYAYWVRVGGRSSGKGRGKKGEWWYREDTWGKKLRRLLIRAEAIYSGILGPGRIFDAERVRRFHALTKEILRNNANAIGREYWSLNTLAVLPAFQKRGIGSQLLEWGLDSIARKEGVPVTVKSTESGFRLYVRKGFKEVGAVQVTESLRVPVMVFEPS